MEELINKNNQLIKEGVETLPHIQHSIDGVTKNYQYYLGSIKKRKKQDEERMQRMRGIKEMRQIEEWTERRITNDMLILKLIKLGGFINDPNSFVFSLESNGKLKGMMKFNIKESKHAFKIYNQLDNCLFSFGLGDIDVYKENNKIKSYCHQDSFEYNGISNVLCGKDYTEYFTPKRIIVIEMK
ncbi:hypothetical protein KM1_058620 [Entamoeba histolytica HM-3:IMSS]|uniref:TLDc domain-containing protein n=1 Tax=Entamoeba histolytica HM-3:IMSS TaxID=885315 RepID=M7VW99_ENTHI|nr:hypothetical protein KM1_058620 [Entamoeba histolytica HM-3:IMSS]